jgi:hypothetical protein
MPLDSKPLGAPRNHRLESRFASRKIQHRAIGSVDNRARVPKERTGEHRHIARHGRRETRGRAIFNYAGDPTSGVAAFFFPNPLARAGLYLFGFSTSLAGLAEAFVLLPRRLERQSRQVFILTPDGLILADREQSEVIRAIDYRAPGKLTLEVATNVEALDLYRLIMSGHGKTTRWTIARYFEVSPAEIASRVMRDYARAQERG